MGNLVPAGTGSFDLLLNEDMLAQAMEVERQPQVRAPCLHALSVFMYPLPRAFPIVGLQTLTLSRPVGALLPLSPAAPCSHTT